MQKFNKKKRFKIKSITIFITKSDERRQHIETADYIFFSQRYDAH